MSKSLDSTEVARKFTSIAREYCGIVESAQNLGRLELLERVHTILPQLICEAVTLPITEIGDTAFRDDEEAQVSTGVEQDRMNEEQSARLYELLKAKLGDMDIYWQVWNPTKDSVAIHGSLADDFADIYSDLKATITRDGDLRGSPEEVIWEWRTGYYSHWGKHAIDGLKTLHFLLQMKHMGLTSS